MNKDQNDREPRKIQGDDLFWLWESHIKRMGINQAPTEDLIDQFLDTIPDDMMQKKHDKAVFKVAMISFKPN